MTLFFPQPKDKNTIGDPGERMARIKVQALDLMAMEELKQLAEDLLLDNQAAMSDLVEIRQAVIAVRQIIDRCIQEGDPTLAKDAAAWLAEYIEPIDIE